MAVIENYQRTTDTFRPNCPLLPGADIKRAVSGQQALVKVIADGLNVYSDLARYLGTGDVEDKVSEVVNKALALKARLDATYLRADPVMYELYESASDKVETAMKSYERKVLKYEDAQRTGVTPASNPPATGTPTLPTLSTLQPATSPSKPTDQTQLSELAALKQQVQTLTQELHKYQINYAELEALRFSANTRTGEVFDMLVAQQLKREVPMTANMQDLNSTDVQGLTQKVTARVIAYLTEQVKETAINSICSIQNSLRANPP